MKEMWLIQNLGTILIALLLCLMVFLAARSIWRAKKSGKSCASCGSCSGCHGLCGRKEIDE